MMAVMFYPSENDLEYTIIHGNFTRLSYRMNEQDFKLQVAHIIKFNLGTQKLPCL